MKSHGNALANPQDNNNIISNEQSADRPWLSSLPKMWWLVSDIYEDSWKIIDASQAKPVTINWDYIFADLNGNISRLIEPENSHLLETAQLACINMREGHLASFSSGRAQYQITNNLLNIIAWMRLHNVFRFEQLTRLEFEAFKQGALYGKTYLLDVIQRLNRYVEAMRKTGQPLPNKPVPGSSQRITMDLSAMSEAIGVDLSAFFTNPIAAHQLTLLKNEEGFRLTRNDKIRLMQEAPEIQLKDDKYIAGLLMPWKYLWDYRTELNDTIKFDPFNGITSINLARKLIKGSGEEPEESYTATIPEYQAAYLIDRSIRWVINYSEDLLILRDEYERIYRECRENYAHSTTSIVANLRMSEFLDSYIPSGFKPDDPEYPSQPWPLASQQKLPLEDSRLPLYKALYNYLPIACLIVICAFTSRRHEEVFNIYDNYPQENDPNKPAIEEDEEGYWLWVWIEKNIQAWDRTPCPRIVVKAVEVLHRLSESARAQTGTRRLFQFELIGIEEINGLTSNGNWVKSFVKFVDVPPLEDGTHWDFTLQQFRKFFAILYMFGYEHGNLSALSHQMRHNNLQITEDYALKHSNDTTLSKLKKNYTASLMVEIATGKRTAAGKAGEILSEMLEKLVKLALKHIKIIPDKCPPDTARRIAEKVMKKLGLNMVPFQWGYCAAFTKLEHSNFKGNCVKSGNHTNSPDLAKATPKTCSGCGHFYTDQNFLNFWQSMSNIYSEISQKHNLTDMFRAFTTEMAVMFERGLNTYFYENTQQGKK